MATVEQDTQKRPFLFIIGSSSGEHLILAEDIVGEMCKHLGLEMKRTQDERGSLTCEVELNDGSKLILLNDYGMDGRGPQRRSLEINNVDSGVCVSARYFESVGYSGAFPDTLIFGFTKNGVRSSLAVNKDGSFNFLPQTNFISINRK